MEKEQPEKKQNDVSEHSFPFKIEHPIEEDRPGRVVNALKDIVNTGLYKLPLSIYLDTCARCNTCAENCHVYRSTGDIKDLPAYRSEQVRKIYKRYLTRSGRLFGRLVGAPELTEDDIDRLLESVYRCTMCRRCNLECPMGVDNALVARVGRVILSYLNLVPSNFEISVQSQLESDSRNTSAIPRAAFIDTLEFLNEEIEEITGKPDLGFPIDREGADILFIAPVSDYMMEADTLMGNAVALNAAGVSWTVGTQYYDAINYGLFYSDEKMVEILKCVQAEAKRLGIKKIIIGECGHATKTLKIFYELFCDTDGMEMESILQFTARAIREGRMKLDRSRVEDTVTYHDPCNLGRMGGVLDEPREILNACTSKFVEMIPSREQNYCCGGGGGTVTVSELHEFRMSVAGKMKIDQIKKSGAGLVAAPCANCKKQIRELIEYHKVDATVIGLHDLILKALVLD